MKSYLIVTVVVLWGFIAVASSDEAWGRKIGSVWRTWGEKRVHMKVCTRDEVKGKCPNRQLTVCVLHERVLKSRKLCDYCSVKKRIVYRRGRCPGDILSKLAAQTGNVYHENHHRENNNRQNSRCKHDKCREERGQTGSHQSSKGREEGRRNKERSTHEVVTTAKMMNPTKQSRTASSAEESVKDMFMHIGNEIWSMIHSKTAGTEMTPAPTSADLQSNSSGMEPITEVEKAVWSALKGSPQMLLPSAVQLLKAKLYAIEKALAIAAAEKESSGESMMPEFSGQTTSGESSGSEIGKEIAGEFANLLFPSSTHVYANPTLTDLETAPMTALPKKRSQIAATSRPPQLEAVEGYLESLVTQSSVKETAESSGASEQPTMESTLHPIPIIIPLLNIIHSGIESIKTIKTDIGLLKENYTIASQKSNVLGEEVYSSEESSGLNPTETLKSILELLATETSITNKASTPAKTTSLYQRIGAARTTISSATSRHSQAVNEGFHSSNVPTEPLEAGSGHAPTQIVISSPSRTLFKIGEQKIEEASGIEAPEQTTGRISSFVGQMSEISQKFPSIETSEDLEVESGHGPTEITMPTKTNTMSKLSKRKKEPLLISKMEASATEAPKQESGQNLVSKGLVNSEALEVESGREPTEITIPTKTETLSKLSKRKKQPPFPAVKIEPTPNEAPEQESGQNLISKELALEKSLTTARPLTSAISSPPAQPNSQPTSAFVKSSGSSASATRYSNFINIAAKQQNFGNLELSGSGMVASYVSPTKKFASANPSDVVETIFNEESLKATKFPILAPNRFTEPSASQETQIESVISSGPTVTSTSTHLTGKKSTTERISIHASKGVKPTISLSKHSLTEKNPSVPVTSRGIFANEENVITSTKAAFVTRIPSTGPATESQTQTITTKKKVSKKKGGEGVLGTFARLLRQLGNVLVGK